MVSSRHLVTVVSNLLSEWVRRRREVGGRFVFFGHLFFYINIPVQKEEPSYVAFLEVSFICCLVVENLKLRSFLIDFLCFQAMEIKPDLIKLVKKIIT